MQRPKWWESLPVKKHRKYGSLQTLGKLSLLLLSILIQNKQQSNFYYCGGMCIPRLIDEDSQTSDDCDITPHTGTRGELQLVHTHTRFLYDLHVPVYLGECFICSAISYLNRLSHSSGVKITSYVYPKSGLYGPLASVTSQQIH